MTNEEQLQHKIEKLTIDCEAANALGAKLLADNIEFMLENVEIKDLLKEAVSDIHTLLKGSKLTPQTCSKCAALPLCNEAGTSCNSDACKWRYADEALKIINGGVER